MQTLERVNWKHLIACLSEKITSICIFFIIFLAHMQDFIKKFITERNDRT